MQRHCLHARALLHLVIIFAAFFFSTAEALDKTHTLSSVMADDAGSRVAAKKSGASWDGEQLVLIDMWQNVESELVRKSCHDAFRNGERHAPDKEVQVVLPPLENDLRWKKMASSWIGLGNGTNPKIDIAGAIKAVVLELDAPHLRPTSILARFKAGTVLACHSLTSLMRNLRSHVEQHAEL